MLNEQLEATGGLKLTLHAALRMAQRSKSRDLELMQAHATPVEAGYVMKASDVQVAAAELKSRINQLERLRNQVLIVSGKTVVTSYQGDRAKQRRLLRGMPR